MSFQEADSRSVNPFFSDYSKIGYRHNCQACVATFIARRQGYNVSALPNLNNRQIYMLSYNTSLAYLTPNQEHPKYILKPKGVNKIKFLESQIKQGEIYSVEFNWIGASCGRSHIFMDTIFREGKILHPYLHSCIL